MKFKPATFIAPLFASALLLACGGGGTSSPTTSTSPTTSPSSDAPPSADSSGSQTTSGSVLVTVPSAGKIQWNKIESLQITPKDSLGNIVSNPICTSDSANITVSANCNSITGARIGTHTISVSAAGVNQTFTIQVIPQRQPIATHATASSSGAGDVNMVVTPQENLIAWGKNEYGVLGQGKDGIAFPNSPLPVLVMNQSGTAPLDNVVAASVGETSALAVTENGEVLSWGSNGQNQLGNNTILNSTSLPVAVLNASGLGHLGHIVAVSQGSWNSAALSDDGTVFAWGWGYTAGQGTALDVAAFPVQVKDPSGAGVLQNIVAISAGRDFTLALSRDGKVFAWGKNEQGQLGNGTASTQTVFLPTVVQKATGGDLTDIVSISAGYAHSMAVSADGSVYVWGSDTEGQLGIGTPLGGSSYKRSAVQPLNQAGTGVLEGIASVAVGGNSSYAVDTDGNVFAWGFGASGQLGDGPNRPTGNGVSHPHSVVSNSGTGQLTGSVGVAAGYAHAMALMPDGTLQIWGSGFAGNLGQGTASTTNSAVPIYVKDPAGAGNLNIAPLTTDRTAFMRFR